MGRKARQKQRDADLRKQPHEKKRAFVARKVAELRELDGRIERVIQG